MNLHQVLLSPHLFHLLEIVHVIVVLGPLDKIGLAYFCTYSDCKGGIRSPADK